MDASHNSWNGRWDSQMVKEVALFCDRLLFFKGREVSSSCLLPSGILLIALAPKDAAYPRAAYPFYIHCCRKGDATAKHSSPGRVVLLSTWSDFIKTA